MAEDEDSISEGGLGRPGPLDEPRIGCSRQVAGAFDAPLAFRVCALAHEEQRERRRNGIMQHVRHANIVHPEFRIGLPGVGNSTFMSRECEKWAICWNRRRLQRRLPRERDTHMTADTTTEAEVITTDGIVLTDTAALKVKTLLEAEGRDDLALRVAVQPGGCSGLRYQLFFDDRSLDGDVVREFGGVGVVTDRMSAPYLSGATIDFVDTIEKQGFTIDNPNAGSSCACGDSFS